MIICACYEQLTRVFAHFGLTEDEKRWKSEKQMKLRIMVITLMTLTTECSAPAINLNDVKFVRTSVFWLIYVGLHLIIFFRNCGTSIVAQRILRFSFLFNSFIFFFLVYCNKQPALRRWQFSSDELWLYCCYMRIIYEVLKQYVA